MIEDYSFGKMVVCGKLYTRDIKIIEGVVIADWWRRDGHSVVTEDVLDIMASKPETLVLGKGQPGQMTATALMRAAMAKQNTLLIEEDTPTAIRTFNRLFENGEKVAGGFHLTC